MNPVDHPHGGALATAAAIRVAVGHADQGLQTRQNKRTER